MSYNNTNYEYGSYIKPTLSAGVYTYSYSSLTLNSDLSDQDQIIVVRKFTTSDAFEAAAAPSGLGGTKITGAEYWDAWTLPSGAASGSPMYSIDTVGKTITMSTTASDYSWNRSGTTITLPAFDPSSDELYIVRRTANVNPFVTWQSSSKLTADQLNLETKQLLYSVQETLDELKRFKELNPFYNSAEGLCPLDSTGVVPEANLGANSVISALSGRTITAGTGLSGGGTLSTDISLNVDTTTFPYTAGKALTYTGSQLDVDTLNGNANDSGLNFSGTQLYVYTANDLVTDVSSRALSAAQGVVLKGLIDNLGTGVRYLGSVTPAVQAELKITFSGQPSNDETIRLISAGIVTDKLYTAKTSGANAAAQEFNIGADKDETATNLANLISGGYGHAGQLIVSDNGSGVLTITQIEGGTVGNTVVTNGLTNVTAVGNVLNTSNEFDGGTAQSTFPAHVGSDYARGDTVDILGPGTVVTPAVGGGAGSDQLDELTTGLDIRYDGSDWYNAGTTATIDTSLFVAVDGGSTMSGALDMGTNKIINLTAPDDAGDVANKTYVDAHVSTQLLSTLSDVTGTATGGDIIKRNSGNTEWVLVPPSDTIDGIKIDDLSNTNITSIANNDILVYNASSSKWLNSNAYATPQTWYSDGTGANQLTGGLTGGFGDGSDTTFTLGETPASTVSSAFVITLDGVVQQASTYTITGTTLTFTTAPPYGVEIYAVCLGISREVTGAIDATTLDVSASATLDSTLSVGSTLNVTGATTVTDLTVTGDFNVTSAGSRSSEGIEAIEVLQQKTFQFNAPAGTVNGVLNTLVNTGVTCTFTPSMVGSIIKIEGLCCFRMYQTAHGYHVIIKNPDLTGVGERPTNAHKYWIPGAERGRCLTSSGIFSHSRRCTYIRRYRGRGLEN